MAIKKTHMRKILYLFLLISLTAFGQPTSNEIKTNIQNSKTSNHINIPGTRLYIIPPPNFKVAENFSGLEKGDSSKFLVNDMIGGSFNINADAFTKYKEDYEKQGAKTIDFKEIKINNYPAKFFHTQGDGMHHLCVIAFGDSHFITTIMINYLAADDKTGNEIINSLNTIYYDKNKIITPFEVTIFSLDNTKSKFKLSENMGSIYYYTINGIKNNEDKDAPKFIMSQVTKDSTMTVKSIIEGAILQQEGWQENPELKNISTVKINGYDTYQVEVHGKIKDKDRLLYYCVVAKGDKAIILQGVATNDREDNLQEFKKLATTIHIK